MKITEVTKICGSVNELKESIEIDDTGETETTRHNKNFKVNSISCFYSSAASVTINNGDDLEAAGYKRAGIFHILAFYNRTSGKKIYGTNLFLIGFGAFAIIGSTIFLVNFRDWQIPLISIISLLTGIFMILGQVPGIKADSLIRKTS